MPVILHRRVRFFMSIFSTPARWFKASLYLACAIIVAAVAFCHHIEQSCCPLPPFRNSLEMGPPSHEPTFKGTRIVHFLLILKLCWLKFIFLKRKELKACIQKCLLFTQSLWNLAKMSNSWPAHIIMIGWKLWIFY